MNLKVIKLMRYLTYCQIKGLLKVMKLDGKYGMTQNTLAIRVNDEQEAALLKQALESRLMSKLIKACNWHQGYFDWRTLLERVDRKRGDASK